MEDSIHRKITRLYRSTDPSACSLTSLTQFNRDIVKILNQYLTHCHCHLHQYISEFLLRTIHLYFACFYLLHSRQYSTLSCVYLILWIHLHSQQTFSCFGYQFMVLYHLFMVCKMNGVCGTETLIKVFCYFMWNTKWRSIDSTPVGLG